MPAMDAPAWLEANLVPDRLWQVEGNGVLSFLDATKQTLKDKLVNATLFPNAGRVPCQMGEVVCGVTYDVTTDVPLKDLAPHIGPLYLNVAVFDLGVLSKDQLETCTKVWPKFVESLREREVPLLQDTLDAESNLLSAFSNGSKDFEWTCSLSTHYPAFCGLYSRTNEGNTTYHFYIAGGHEAMNRALLTEISNSPKATVGDLLSPSKMGPIVDAIKEFQVINHTFMASKLQALLQGQSYDPINRGFSAPQITMSYSAFYNTVRFGPKNVCRVAQGVLDVQDISRTRNTPDEPLCLFLMESPLKIHTLEIKRENASHVRYFPLTTGFTPKGKIGMSIEDKQALTAKLAWTGWLGVHPSSITEYQPYDTTFKIKSNALFTTHGYSIVERDYALKGIDFCTSGIHPHSLTIDNFNDLLGGNHLERVRVPIDSAPAKMVIKVYPRLAELLRGNDRRVSLVDLLAAEPRNPKYVSISGETLSMARILWNNADLPLAKQCVTETLQGVLTQK